MHIDTNVWKGSAHSVLDEFLYELQNKSTNIRANVTSHPVNNVLHNINSPEPRLANNGCALPPVFLTPQTAGSKTNHQEIASTTTKTSHSRSCSADEVLRAAASGNANDDSFPARASELLDLVERNASAQRRLAHTPTVRTELVGYNNLAHISQLSGEPYTFGNDGRVFLATTESCGPQITPLGSPIQGEHGVTHSHGVNCQLSPFSHAAQQQLSSSAHTVPIRPLHLLDVHTDNITINCSAKTHCTNCHQYKPLHAPCGLNYDDYNSNVKVGGQGLEKRRASNSFTQQYASIHFQNNLLSSYCGTPTKSRCDETQVGYQSEVKEYNKALDNRVASLKSTVIR
ncbi:hypothetical protein SARC_10716 [Sphaeroforma arctica JP610]|uniref:Uncharacterized protein n=1 Tax=Sphaeroforma arctica JP610 TaxID=667725 RepID=A0A0L0FJ43_9EUKA|nr:hypothetical protein SARC_10716 [Sphaeroforma arctica JP610]KNC76804.1 hypothetical protein SARC_10716 [Sphaeroforma arctica JP610]|eukprot:XP_014150706.1 hypothetical protein SARC_10716 [Sphaeroforma arctica JP610]